MPVPGYYFAVGASLAALKNVQDTFDTPPTTLPNRRIPLLGPVRTRTLDRALSRSGNVDVPLQWDMVNNADIGTFIALVWGSYLISSKAVYASWIDESGHYSPFAVTLERPVEGEHFERIDTVRAQNLLIPAYGWTLQSSTVSANHTVTTSERLLYVDTSGGNRTMTLPAAATPNPYTIFSFVKTSASNNLVLDGNGSELVDGATTKTITTLNARTDIYSDGAAWHSI